MMPVRLRGHHFLCMLTYKGLGYSAPFIATMTEVIGRVDAGAPLELASGPDEICAGLTEACRAATGHDCLDPDTLRMDAVARADVERLLGRDLSVAAPVTSGEVARLRAAFAKGDVRRACAACPWHAICTRIAEGGFGDAMLGRGGAP
jgi:hypothetical protein